MITIQHRRGTSAEWTASNPVLAAGEFGVELDTNKFKVGNGTTPWLDLQYSGVTDHGALVGLTDDDHPQYLTEQRGDSRYAQGEHTHDGTYINVSGDTMQGPLGLQPVAPTDPNWATPRFYVDQLITVSDVPPSDAPARDGLLWIVVAT